MSITQEQLTALLAERPRQDPRDHPSTSGSSTGRVRKSHRRLPSRYGVLAQRKPK
jgi:hypothetical protein